MKAKRSRYLKIVGSLVFLIVIGSLIFSNSFQIKKFGIAEPRPNFTVKINECKFDGTQQGVLSFSFDITVTENQNRIPGEIVFQIVDVLKNYSFHKYPFYHKANLTREYEFDRVFHENETIENVAFVIDNVYRDYMYLPSEYFNYQLYYCEYTDEELKNLKDNKRIFDVLDNDCLLFFDYEIFYQDHMYSINQHPNVQCIYLPRTISP